MDSLTQIALGSCVAAACVPAPQRRRAAVVGAVLGTLPDLDVLIDYGDPVANFTMHRGFSHSLGVLAIAAFIIWLVLKNWSPVRQASGRWFAAILLALFTHPLLDAHTAYGTQLFWPVDWTPISWATIFIIDPLYTIPLLAGLLTVMIRPASRAAGICLAVALVSSSLYLGWSWTAKAIVKRNAQAGLEKMGVHGARLFITPTPFNTLLWRVVARTEGGHFEGLDSLASKNRAIDFMFHPSHDELLAATGNFPAVKRLVWFSGGFVAADIEEDRLVISDLRMGRHPDYVFRHAVAKRGNPHWQEMEPERLKTVFSTRRLKTLWESFQRDDGGVGHRAP